MQLIGGGGWGSGFTTLVKQLVRRGRPLTVSRAVSDAELDQAFRHRPLQRLRLVARGLRTAGGRIAGLRLAGDHRRVRQHGRDRLAGGALLIDPRDDDELVDAMRTLLTDDEVLASCEPKRRRRQRAAGTTTARELWSGLVEPERVAVSS